MKDFDRKGLSEDFAKRMELIADMRGEGLTYEAIGKVLGISARRAVAVFHAYERRVAARYDRLNFDAAVKRANEKWYLGNHPSTKELKGSMDKLADGWRPEWEKGP